MSAVAGDSFRGNRRGDYEIAVTVTSLSQTGAELQASSFVRNYAGQHEWLRFRRSILASDLRSARTQVLGFASEDVPTVPGTTSLGPSLQVMGEAREKGRVEFKVRNYADRRDNPGTLRRVRVDSLPVLLNGSRVKLPAVHMRGQLGPPGHLRPCSFDSIGGARYNQGLSERRAAALRRELVGRHGIDAARLGTQGFGTARPLEPNTTLEGRARNRRVELVRPCDNANDAKPRKGD